MRVLLECVNPVLRRSITTALERHGHEVRHLSQPAARPDAGPAPVEPHAETAGEPARSTGGWDCEAAVVVDPRIGGVDRDALASLPFDRAVAESRRAGVTRAILVQAAPPGVEQPPFDEWLTIDGADVYGTTHDPVTLLLIMMRSLPAVPVLGDAHVMQPLWHGDLAEAIAVAVSLPAARLNRAVRATAAEPVTHAVLYDRIAALIDRRPLRVPVPDFVATHGARLAEALRLPVPLEGSHLAFGRASRGAAETSGDLESLTGTTPVALDAGLRRLIAGLDEVTPAEGVGSLEVKRFHAEIAGSRYGATELLRQFRARFADMMPVPVGVEPAAPGTSLDEGTVLTIALPGRGHVQVRVEDVTDGHVVVGTLRGHSVAGIVRFTAQAVKGAVRFEIMTCDAAANAADWIALTLGGARIQDANWARVVQNVVTLSGGTGDVHHDSRTLEPAEADVVTRWIAATAESARAGRDHSGA